MKLTNPISEQSVFVKKRERGTKGKTIVLGILNRGGKMDTQMIPNVKKSSILNIIQEKVEYDTIVNTDGWIVYYY